MVSVSIGGTIALPNYSNIKVEVTGNNYSHAKALLRVTLLNMHNDHNALHIESWWTITFNEPWKTHGD